MVEQKQQILLHNIIRKWIVEILENHQQLLAIAIRQRAKFEGWLKFELAAVAEKYGAQSLELESTYNEEESIGKRSDLAFYFFGNRYNVELKTANTNWKIQGVLNRHRPITKNIKGIINDARKLTHCAGQGIMAFVLFPIPLHDKRWTKYIERIFKELAIPLSEASYCSRFSINLGGDKMADLIVCSFAVSNVSERLRGRIN